jgi:hypothetical protein
MTAKQHRERLPVTKRKPQHGGGIPSSIYSIADLEMIAPRKRGRLGIQVVRPSASIRGAHMRRQAYAQPGGRRGARYPK